MNSFEKTAAQAGFSFTEAPEIFTTPNFNINHNCELPIVVDLFAGCGGASLGMHNAGFHPAIAVEWNQWNLLTYMRNLGLNKNKPVTFIRKDITTVTGIEISKYLVKMKYKKRPDMIWGSPPCQDWSSANVNAKNLDFSLFAGRRYCMLEYVRLVKELKPKLIGMENVKGLVNKTFKPLFDEFCFRLRNIGYEISWQVLNSSDYGVPQNRERIILLGQDVTQLKKTEPTELTDYLKSIFSQELTS